MSKSDREVLAEFEGHYSTNFRKVVFQVLVLWSLALLAVGLSFVIDIKGETVASLFQRSGAVVVAFALLADIATFKFDVFISGPNQHSIGADIVRKLNVHRVKPYQVGSIFLAIIGTIAWGYGDLLIKGMC